MYGTDLTTSLYVGSTGFAGTLASAGNRLWMPFALVALGFASISLKQLLTRPKPHRP